MAQSEEMHAAWNSSYLCSGGTYLESLYETYLSNPSAVPSEFKAFFDQMACPADATQMLTEVREYIKQRARHPAQVIDATPVRGKGLLEAFKKQVAVQNLVQAYRAHGHSFASLDPLKLVQPARPENLSFEYYGLHLADLSTTFETDIVGCNEATLQNIIQRLEHIYCNTIGIEYQHISSAEEVRWIQQRIESNGLHQQLTPDEKKLILRRLTAAEGLEKYLGSKFVGQKRFSLEGGESLIPLLDTLIVGSSKKGVTEIVIGMAHRGRLNVLVNILGKAPQELFKQFEGKHIENDRSGDVKYHQGFSSDWCTAYMIKGESTTLQGHSLNGDGYMHLSLAFNPSHLEIISPVVEGGVRAKQERQRNDGYTKVMPIAIHGDAAFAGQGVVMETFNMSQTRGYKTGGTIHIVINNQVGFTTSRPEDARSTPYCTDVAKMVEAPIVHVNGDDVEACIFAAKMAADYRAKFARDIVIDIVCYRRHGHNEADEPSATQPVMYKVIRALPTLRQKYSEQLIAAGIVSESEVTGYINLYRDALDAGHPVVEYLAPKDYRHPLFVDWTRYLKHSWDEPVATGVPEPVLKQLAIALEQLPENFSVQPQVAKLLLDRQQMTAGTLALNWGYAEILAYASLLNEGYGLRLSGQDCRRGTFAHRHAVLYDQSSGQEYMPLQHLNPNQASAEIIDSVLSEAAVVAFEYGFASAEPRKLVIWEAQFGDFANGAQVVIDQFISSGEQKWGRLCGLVLFLPHGYEGQGPEHTSARLERFLQLCAQQNVQVCVPTTPAQMFHLLRRQMLRDYRKPLIIMMPKSLLRHKLAVSSFADLVSSQFLTVIGETQELQPRDVVRVILCSGKVYYDLIEERNTRGCKDVVILRVEQLYPFPEEQLKQQLLLYKKAPIVIWCQEEPMNQGAWYSSQHHFMECLQPGQKLRYAGREASASPATGSPRIHTKEQQALVQQAFECNI